jgi:hypothetical protein
MAQELKYGRESVLCDEHVIKGLVVAWPFRRSLPPFLRGHVGVYHSAEHAFQASRAMDIGSAMRMEIGDDCSGMGRASPFARDDILKAKFTLGSERGNYLVSTAPLRLVNINDDLAGERLMRLRDALLSDTLAVSGTILGLSTAEEDSDSLFDALMLANA